MGLATLKPLDQTLNCLEALRIPLSDTQLFKVDVPNLVAYLNWTPRLICGSMWLQERYQKTTCLKDIGLRSQNKMTILGPIINITGEGTCMSI